MRKLTLVAVATLAAVVPSLVVAAPGQAKPPRPKAELVAKQVTASLTTGGQVTAAASVKNKGNKKAPASTATFYLSTDAKQDSTDVSIGTAPVGPVKPKKSKPAGGTFAVPATVTPGTYHVVVCADSAGVVKERKETNNCKGSQGTVALTGDTTGPVTISATAGVGGTVMASNITGGTCPGNVCTFPSGAGKVTFTPTVNASYRFGSWTGATCTGYTTGPNDAITFTNPKSSRACTATFVKQVLVSWSVHVPLTGTVAGVATHGTCSASNPLTGAGDCLVDAGVGTVTLTATATLPFTGWSGATCDGTAVANVMTLTAPAADKACTATFTL